MQANKKQISLIVVTLFAFAIFLWQLIALFHNDISAKTSAPILAKTIETAKPSVATPNIQKSATPVLAETASPQQEAYLTLLNRYQLAKMQHKLLQEELAIANARQKISALNQKNTLDTIPEERNNPNTGFGTEITNKNQQLPFKLVYLGFQNGHWSATIHQKGHYRQLDKGMTLADGTHITNVDKNGIEFQNNQQQSYRLTFTELTLLTAPVPTDTTATPKKPIITPSDTARKITPPLLPSEKKSAKSAEKISTNIAATQNSAAKAANQPHTLDETVLLEMPPSSYTIKLMVGHKDRLLRFARKHHITDRTLCYSNIHSPHEQYTLVYGDYLTTRAAVSALNHLPPPLLQHPLCIQRLELIQREIAGSEPQP
ncbi:MAG: hypothetical protein A3F17_03400 [Gammaproteobacteria bacterium RIFCSPHIGHO2_12_FULL_41_15]|nr:MAG: hypothetical protein A3F17_03400 [Gammaproteobacteria bacterium RIFCSPHIGHO2_12_FULL_41_15]